MKKMSEYEEDIQRVQTSFGDLLESHASFNNPHIPIQPFSLNFNDESNGRRVGMPPAHPQIPINRRPGSNNQTSSHPLFFSVASLPPLSPSSNQGPTSDQVVGDVSLPPRKTHRRSNSDIPFGFSSILQSSPPLIPLRSEGEVVDGWFSSYVSLNNLGKLNSLKPEIGEDLDSRASGTKANGGDSSDNEATSSVIGSSYNIQGSGICSVSDKRPYRSVSMDSVMGKMSFVDESLKLLPSPGGQIGKLPSPGSVDVNLDAFSLEFGNGLFNGDELKKIVGNENLAEMALTDPKRVKRILANRQSAARSKERKMRYIAELENKVQTLQTESTRLSARITLLQGELTSLTSQNNELKFRVEAMEQQAHLRNALNNTLNSEVQRLKIMRMELSADATNFPQLSINSQMFQYHHQQKQEQ